MTRVFFVAPLLLSLVCGCSAKKICKTAGGVAAVGSVLFLKAALNSNKCDREELKEEVREELRKEEAWRRYWQNHPLPLGPAQQPYRTINRVEPHVSKVPAIEAQLKTNLKP